jgi:hypothetical protein
MDKRYPILISGLVALLICSTAGAIELNYQWKQGDVHRFDYQDETKFVMSAGAMGAQTMTLKVMSTFSQKVLSVAADGTAEIEFTLEKLQLQQGNRQASTLKQIPPLARTARAEVDTKGHAKFVQMVTMYVHENRVYLGVRKFAAGPDGASASVEAGGPEGGVAVDLVAAIDPKTGKVTASAKAREIPAELKKVTLKQDDPGVDVLPRQIFELMVLPEGQFSPGGSLQTDTPFGKISATLETFEKGLAKLTMTIEGKQVAVGAGGLPPDGDAPPDMGAMMGGQLGGMLGGGPGGGMKADVASSLRFDVGVGKLLQIKGQIKTEMSMGGMAGVKTDTAFDLKRI